MTNKGSNPFAEVLERLKLEEIGRFFSDSRILSGLKRMAELSKIGARVIEGARKPRNRRHALGDLIERIYRDLAAEGHDPTAEEIFDAIEFEYKADCDDIIQEIKDDTIYWIDERGKEHEMKIGTVRNRLTKLRKTGSQS